MARALFVPVCALSVLLAVLAARGALANEVDSRGCGVTGGCGKMGYCWASCDATFFPNEWCFTTKGGGVRAQCRKDSDCNKCWKCSGPCTVFGNKDKPWMGGIDVGGEIDENGCSRRVGCDYPRGANSEGKKYCWGSCQATYLSDFDWCWLSRTGTLSYKGIECKSVADCNRCDKCADICRSINHPRRPPPNHPNAYYDRRSAASPMGGQLPWWARSSGPLVGPSAGVDYADDYSDDYA